MDWHFDTGLRADLFGVFREREENVMKLGKKNLLVDRIWRGAEYRIRVTNPKGVEKGVAEIRLNGETVDSIPVQAPGSVSEIEVIMG